MSALPTGTVTFLFTDVEGSTTRWEHDRVAMQAAMARHDALLRSSIEEHQGAVFKMVGDAVCATFSTAVDALEAALAAQHALAVEPWPPGGDIRVRMALHTGVVEERDGDYFGPPVNRVARLLSTGHGGQVLLSAVTAGLVQESLPTTVTLVDLGEHGLKDLTRPEHIFQILASNLPINQAPLRTLDARPNNLPIQPTPFVGRSRELQEIGALLQREEVRLVTQTGPAGSGKTRLALQVAAESLDRYQDGVFFIALGPINNPDLVAGTMAMTLNVQGAAGEPIVKVLIATLREEQMLLILDNFEQVLPAASQIAEILGACPALSILLTSRTSLRLSGEREYPVPTLTVPDPRHLPPLESLGSIESVALFVDRAQAARPTFTLTAENARAVVEICERLDGLPLAIELAAARIKLFPPSALLSRLSRRLKLLTGGARDLPERQQTLRGAIDWSQSLLYPDQQTLFARLSVFNGGCSFEAAEAVCNAQGELDLLEDITGLVDQSLVQQVGEQEPRFRMLQTIQEYAGERLDQRGEPEKVQSAHAAYFLELVEGIQTDMAGPKQATRLAELDTEIDNLRAALTCLLERGDVGQALRLIVALRHFWYERGYWIEATHWLEKGLNAAGKVDVPLRAQALWALARFVSSQGEQDRARELYDEAIAIFRQTGNERARDEVLLDQGVNAIMRAEYARARVYLMEALPVARKVDDQRTAARALLNLGVVAVDEGKPAEGRDHYEEALALFQKLGDKGNIAKVLINLGYNARQREQPEEAVARFEEGLITAREVGAKYAVAYALDNLATMNMEREHYDRALEQYTEALRLCREMGDKRLTLGLPGDMAELAVRMGDAQRSARLAGAEAHLRDIPGLPFGPDVDGWEQTSRTVTEQLGQEQWQRFDAEGRAMGIEEAIAYALGEAQFQVVGRPILPSRT